MRRGSRKSSNDNPDGKGHLSDQIYAGFINKVFRSQMIPEALQEIDIAYALYGIV